MTIARTAFVTLAAAALLQSQAAAAQAPCLTEAEISGMVAFSMPAVLQGVMTSCKPHLSAQGFFAQQGPAMVQRYSADKDAAWPLAKTAFLKFGAEKDDKTMEQVANLPDDALKPFVEGMVQQMVSGEIKPASCAPIERATMLLEPLPAKNTASLVAFIVAMVSDKPGGKSKVVVCKAQS